MKLSLGYMAGYFDGEGSIGLYKTLKYKNRRTPVWAYSRRITVTNTYLPILKKFKKLFGGSILEYSDKHRHKRCYYWKLNSKSMIINFLNFIYPSLHEKKRQARLMLKSCQHPGDEERIYLELKRLKKIGTKTV